MVGFPILSAMMLVPLVGAAWILLAPGGDEAARARNARMTALITTLVAFALSVVLWLNFDSSTADFQFVENVPLLGAYFSYHLGVDGISMLLVVLSAFLMPLCILASWEAIEKRVVEYMAAFLLMETLMFGVFMSLDMFLFYIFFEGGLIPMYLIIGVWGGKRRIYASFKFFLYTLLGSLFMLLAMLYMAGQAGTTSIPALMEYGFDPNIQTWLWLAFFASFAVKMPMWPVHTWLPDAHVEAPTAGSVILAGVLLKMGGYGFLRFSLPMFPEASHALAWLVFALSVIAIVYTSLVAIVQEDMKKLIAYSSVAHMGFVTVGLFAFNQQGLEGSIFQMLSHGIVSGALFLCVGVVYDRMHTREIAAYGGLVNRMPLYALVFLVFTMASIGLPGTSGFVGEFLIMTGAYQASTLVAFITATGVILGAAYMLLLYRRVVYGELTKESLKNILDLNVREVATFAPLIAVVFWMGVYPNSFLAPLHAPVEKLLAQTTIKTETAAPAQPAAPVAAEAAPEAAPAEAAPEAAPAAAEPTE
ncbi:NADH-quinone oxidoreductase subunit M [Pedomonas sp. V897]|uniref:NADH-quinone oxidoreductase subunit M n=1 Tax=Pedomonas sp. V897 TaxID=3446482 RepID=UPI003EE33915